MDIRNNFERFGPLYLAIIYWGIALINFNIFDRSPLTLFFTVFTFFTAGTLHFVRFLISLHKRYKMHNAAMEGKTSSNHEQGK